MFSYRDNLRGIATMCVSIAAFITSDALIKRAGETLPVGEIMFVRGLVGSAVIAAVVVAMGQHRQLRLLLDRRVVWRTVGEVGGTITYLTALFALPIANATTVMQSVPLVVAAAGAIFLGHRVGWRNWTAIVIGFIGVLVVVRPGLEGFDANTLLVLVSVLFVALRDIVTAGLPRTIPTVLITALAMVAITLSGPVMGLAEDWVALDGAAMLDLLGSAVLLLFGFSFIIIALRTGDVAVTAPFRYTGILWATFYGYTFWGDLPDAATYVGMALIAGTGLYTFLRERQLSRRGEGEPTLAREVLGVVEDAPGAETGHNVRIYPSALE